MEGTLKLVGMSSGETYNMRYPNSLLEFCDYDLSYFAKTSIELCDEAFKSGELDPDKASALRLDITPAHCYIEHHIRTTYEHIVEDCWIDFICHRDSIGTNTLWNRFMRCKTPFEKTIFARLCEFRYNHAINQWLNVVRVQEYAKEKVKFIFMQKIKNISEAATRRNYFDLVFSVTAKEMGCRIEDLGVTKVFSVGRIPTAPFMFSNTSKEIMRSILADFNYNDDYSDIGDYSNISDKIAMDAYAQMKEGLSADIPTYTLTKNKLDSYTERIYMPCSLKAAIDLEIDILIESGSWLSKCKRCGRFFLCNNEHPEEYCSRVVNGGKTCLEIYEEEHPRPKMTEELEQKCSDVTNEVYKRVDKTMSLKEYETWHSYLEAMKEKVNSGEITSEELDDFLDYSLEVDISKSNPIVEVPKDGEGKDEKIEKIAEQTDKGPKERIVRPFIPERISRSELEKQQPAPVISEPAVSEGFFTSPTFQRQKSERPQISHIIRNGESLGDNSHMSTANPAGFTLFGQPQRTENIDSQSNSLYREIPANIKFPDFNEKKDKPKTLSELKSRSAERFERDPYEDLKRLEEKLDEERRLRMELEARMFSSTENELSSVQRKKPQEKTVPNNAAFDEIEAVRSRAKRFKKADEPEKIEEQSDFQPDVFEPFTAAGDNLSEESSVSEEYASAFDAVYESKSENRTAENTEDKRYNEPVEKELAAPQRPKVIRKNAAAISAYGKIAGTPLTSAPPTMEINSNSIDESVNVSVNNQSDESNMPDPEPFKDIGSIFDVLEQSEEGLGSHGRQRIKHSSKKLEDEAEQVPEAEELPERITSSNAPEGFWKEERDLFPDTDDTEEKSAVERRRGKTNKTRRLYDIIMRDADDNPNFRR